MNFVLSHITHNNFECDVILISNPHASMFRLNASEDESENILGCLQVPICEIDD